MSNYQISHFTMACGKHYSGDKKRVLKQVELHKKICKPCREITDVHHGQSILNGECGDVSYQLHEALKGVESKEMFSIDDLLSRNVRKKELKKLMKKHGLS